MKRQIVIEIEDDLYREIYSDAEIMIYGMRSGKTLLATLLRTIRNGMPLPKGHGDLIDADKLIDTVPDLNEFEEETFYTTTMLDLICDAPIIIKADEANTDKE